MRHLVAISMLTAALTGCGPNTLMATGGSTVAPEAASGWTTVKVTPDGVMGVSPCLIQRKAGGYAITYATDKLGDRHVYFTASSDGSRWSTPVAIAQGRLTDEAPTLWEDAAGTLHVVFGSNRAQQYDLYESTSTDGATWTDAQSLPSDPDQADHPVVVPLASGSLALAYETIGGAIHFRTKNAQGTWSAPMDLYDGGADPAMTLGSDGKLVLAFSSYGKLYVETQDTMGMWSKPSVLSADGDTETPSLSQDGHGGLWLVYASQPDNSWKLQQRTKTNGTWGAGNGLTTGPTDDEHPSALVNHSGEPVLAFAVSSRARSGGIYFAHHS